MKNLTTLRKAQIKNFLLFINVEFIEKGIKSTDSTVPFCNFFTKYPEVLYGSLKTQKDVLAISGKINKLREDKMSWDDLAKVSYVSDGVIIKEFMERTVENSTYMTLEQYDEFVEVFLEYMRTTLQQTHYNKIKKVLNKYYIALPKEIEDYEKILEHSTQSLYGYLFRRRVVSEEDAAIQIEEEKKRGFDLDIDIQVDSDNPLAFKKDVLDKIMGMENDQGYAFNTNILKLSIDLQFMTDYQLKILEDFGNFDDLYLVATRRAGKTWLFVYLAIRQLFLQNQTIVYLVPTEKFFKQPMMYFMRFLQEITKADKNIKLRKDENAIYNESTNSVIWFISAQGMHGVRSQEATLAIVDEASFVPDSEARSVETMLEQVRSMRDKGIKDGGLPVGKLVAGSTINRKVPKNWFAKDVKRAETGENEDGSALRVSIFQCPFYTDKAREKLVEKYENDPEGLKSELLAQFSSENERFDLDKIVVENEQNLTEYRSIESCLMTHGKPNSLAKKMQIKPVLYMAYDPAKKLTNAGVTMTEFYFNAQSPSKSRIISFGEIIIPKHMAYMTQAKVIADCYENLKNYYSKIYFVIDNGGVGEPVSEMVRAEGIPMTRVQYLNGEAYTKTKFANAPFVNENGIFYINKTFLLDIIPNLVKSKKYTLWRTPKVFGDFETFNDIVNYNPSKDSIDYYNSLSVAAFNIILNHPEVYYDKEFVNKNKDHFDIKTLVNQEFSERTNTGLVINRMAQNPNQNSTSSRMAKFGY